MALMSNSFGIVSSLDVDRGSEASRGYGETAVEARSVCGDG
jgi:hypothetical protein